MLLELNRLEIPPGQTILLRDVSWQEFEQILQELGESRAARIAYNHKTLEIMTPLPEHEINKQLIGSLIAALLEELEIEFISLGSTTFKNAAMGQGLEPDDCFYIKNEAVVRGKSRLDLTVDPPPDLAIEIDVTSRTHPDIYLSLKVSELWRFENNRLQINVLENDQYVEKQFSSFFPNLPLLDTIPEYLNRAKTEGRNRAMKAFRSWIRARIQQ